MKYLLSGAWGYGNIGDDAILEATIPLIRKHDPNAEITCVTYDLKYTREAKLGLPEPLLLSMHRVLSGTEGFWYMTEKDHAIGSYSWPHIPQRIYQRVLQPLFERVSIFVDKLKTVGGYADLEAAFRDADVFLMSGGGYFNTWQTQFRARVRELELAHKYDCKVLLFGQSIGPFTDQQKEILKKAIKSSDEICVRDSESVSELQTLGFQSALAPDLAMGVIRPAKIEKGLLTICPAEIRKEQEIVLADQIAKLVSEYGYKVRLTITRWIDPDVATLKRMESLLKRRGVADVEVQYPRTYTDVLRALEGSEWVVSRGLHAMILSWRAGSRVFAITRSRKVDGFLLAIGSPGNQCQERDWGHLAEKFVSCAKEPFAWEEALHRNVAEKIEIEFKNAFNRLGIG